MKFLKFICKCESCKKEFEIPRLPGNPYGEFLMRNKNGRLAYLNAFNDDVFNWLDDVIKNHSLVLKMDRISQARVLQDVFGWTCDLYPNQSNYEINSDIICPACSSVEIISWGPTNPPEYIDLPVDVITHHDWYELTEEERISKVDDIVRLMLQDKK